jgi:4-hydroxy-2-oxoheptanedioate aldolase
MLNKLKAFVESGKPAIGSWIGSADPYPVGSHGTRRLCLATDRYKEFPLHPRESADDLGRDEWEPSVPVARLPINTPEYFQTALDLGAPGVVVPVVSSCDDATRAVTSCQCPPLGTPGLCPGLGPTRASRYS